MHVKIKLFATQLLWGKKAGNNYFSLQEVGKFLLGITLEDNKNMGLLARLKVFHATQHITHTDATLIKQEIIHMSFVFPPQCNHAGHAVILQHAN